jgi:glycosyltransferase involved in cell wall biosynthesis
VVLPSKPPDVAVVVPVLNERDNLRPLLGSLLEVTEALRIVAEIIIVDGGSTDGSQEIARELGAKVVTQSERGYGGALMAGFEATTAPYVVTMDADLSHPPIFINDLWRQRGEAELVIASRFVKGGKADMSPFRRGLSIILNGTYRRVLGLPIADLSSGYRLYHQDVLRKLVFHARDFDVQEEIIVKVQMLGGRIKEVPFHYHPRKSGKSHAKVIKFGWAYLRTLERLRRLHRSSQT